MNIKIGDSVFVQGYGVCQVEKVYNETELKVTTPNVFILEGKPTNQIRVVLLKAWFPCGN